MKTTYGYLNEIVLSLLLLAAFIPAASSQSLTLSSASRVVGNSLSSGDAVAGPYFSSYPGASSSSAGHFSASDTETTPSA